MTHKAVLIKKCRHNGLGQSFWYIETTLNDDMIIMTARVEKLK